MSESIPNHLVFTTKDSFRPRMKCEHCGAAAPLPVPLQLRQFELLTKDFVKTHRKCRPSSSSSSSPH